MRTTNKQAQIGLIGLAPMGRALALNLRDKGYVVAVYNRTESRTREFEKECENEVESSDNKDGMNEGKVVSKSGNDNNDGSKGSKVVPKSSKDSNGNNSTTINNSTSTTTNNNNSTSTNNSSTRLCGDDTSAANTITAKGSFIYTYTIDAFINALQQPRKILTIIKSDATDDLLAQLIPLLSKNDYILDFSNSTPDTTEMRTRSTPCHYLGIGISGGTEGARSNGGLMVGGHSGAYAAVQSILFSISNSVGYFGDGGSGHFVKMVHNAIEYALMGVIAEFWEVLDRLGKHELLANWNEDMRMYLVEAAGRVSENERFKSVEGRVEMKGTGAWVLRQMGGRCRTVLLNCAIDQRMSSIHADTRDDGGASPRSTAITKTKNGEQSDVQSDNAFVTRSKHNLKKAFKMISFSALSDKCLKNAFTFCLMTCYREGLDILSNNGTYKINVKEAVRVWKKGCIVQSNIIDEQIDSNHAKDLKKVILYAVNKNIRIASMCNCYYKEMRSERQLMLLAGLRDYFGAHGVYIDGKWTNVEWRKK